MIEFNTSSLSLVDALTIGAIFGTLVILLGRLIAGWYTSHELKVAEARIIVLRELLAGADKKNDELSKLIADKQWSEIDNVTKISDW